MSFKMLGAVRSSVSPPASTAGLLAATSVPLGVSGINLTRVPSIAGPVWIPASDGVMLPFIKEYQCWEPEEGDLLLQLSTPNMVFLDIGASFGYFTRLIAKRVVHAQVHAFEPHPLMAQILALNTWQFADRVTVWPTGLGAERGAIGLTIDEHNIGDIRVNASGNDTFGVVAPLTPLDDLVNGRVDLVKIDTQGFETDVLAGMTRVCRENAQIKIVAEFWPAAIVDRHLRPVDVLATYRSLGFETCLLRESAAVLAADDEIVLFATGAGRGGQATILLRRPA